MHMQVHHYFLLVCIQNESNTCGMFALYSPLSLDTMEILTIGFVQYLDWKP